MLVSAFTQLKIRNWYNWGFKSVMVFTKEGRLQVESKTCFDVSSYSYCITRFGTKFGSPGTNELVSSVKVVQVTQDMSLEPKCIWNCIFGFWIFAFLFRVIFPSDFSLKSVEMVTAHSLQGGTQRSAHILPVRSLWHNFAFRLGAFFFRISLEYWNFWETNGLERT